MATYRKEDIAYYYSKGGSAIAVPKPGAQPIDADNDKKEQQIAETERVGKELTERSNELNGNQTAQQFNQSITGARNSRSIKDKWRVDVHSADDYMEKGCKCYKSKQGSTVAVTSDGDIISVCKHSKDTEISGSALLRRAVKMGGKKLDSFAGNHRFYTKNGFEPIAYVKFNEKYAPDDWKESKCGKEPVIFYKYVGVGNVKYAGIKGLKEFMTTHKPFRGQNGYDDAYEYRDKQL